MRNWIIERGIDVETRSARGARWFRWFSLLFILAMVLINVVFMAYHGLNWINVAGAIGCAFFGGMAFKRDF
jgi:hypothetical protein